MTNREKKRRSISYREARRIQREFANRAPFDEVDFHLGSENDAISMSTTQDEWPMMSEEEQDAILRQLGKTRADIEPSKGEVGRRTDPEELA